MAHLPSGRSSVRHTAVLDVKDVNPYLDNRFLFHDFKSHLRSCRLHLYEGNWGYHWILKLFVVWVRTRPANAEMKHRAPGRGDAPAAQYAATLTGPLFHPGVLSS